MNGFQLPPVVKLMLIANIAVFAIDQMTLGSVSQYHGLVTEYFALYGMLGDQFQAYQVLSHIFLHSDLSHLFGNMLGLFFFGPLLEAKLGAQRFLFFYLATGVLVGTLYGGIRVYEQTDLRMTLQEVVERDTAPTATELQDIIYKGHWYRYLENDIERFIYEQYPNSPESQNAQSTAKSIAKSFYREVLNTRMVGASGVIFGILMAVALLFPNVEARLLFIPFFPIKMKFLVIAYGGYEFYRLLENSPLDNVAHFAHLAGMLVAFVLIKYWKLRPQ